MSVDLINDLFGDTSDEEEEFWGFTNEEPRVNSDIDVNKISSEDGQADDESNADSEEEGVELEWTKVLTSVEIEPFTEASPGPVTILNGDAKEIDFFALMFPNEIFEILARETNRYAQRKIATKPDSRWRETTPDEIKVFLGLRIYMSIVNLPEMKMYWSTDFAFGNFFPAKIMNRDRFDKLCQ